LVDKFYDPILWIIRQIPRNQNQLEALTKKVLKVAFWIAILAPVILVPLVYLVMAFFR
jgi:hypothetical protein